MLLHRHRAALLITVQDSRTKTHSHVDSDVILSVVALRAKKPLNKAGAEVESENCQMELEARDAIQ